MPLKHATETRLVLFLGMTFVGVGVAVRLLPPLPDGVALFGGVLLLSLFYPFLLLPLFRDRRAEYALRILHFLPFVLLFLWGALHMLRLSGVPVRPIFAWYTWEHVLLPTVFSFLLLFLYCFQVIRQRVFRSIALSGLLLLSVFPSAYSRLDSFRSVFVLSSSVPLGELPPSRSTGERAGGWGGSDKEALSVNTDPSSSLGEEVWRMRLRRMHRRQGRLGREEGLVDRPALPVRGVPVLLQASSSSIPPTLVSSGMDFRLILLLILAGYTGVLHGRARRRG